MSLAQKVRDALKGQSLTKEEIEAAIGEKLSYAISQILKPGQYRTDVIEGVKHYSLADDHIAQHFGSPAPATKPAKKKATKRAKKHPRKLKGFKAAARERLRKIARKYTRRSATPVAPDYRDIALANYMAIVDGLIATVRHEVEDIEQCTPLITQLDNVERAKQLYQAVPA